MFSLIASRLHRSENNRRHGFRVRGIFVKVLMSPEFQGFMKLRARPSKSAAFQNKCGASRQINGGNLRVKLQHAPGEIFGKYW
ncbi:hypothetical protein ASC96_28520 [Rhizobium sp. Root1204]|nr:hypothetical protein ASC96_28520 [Rhizobium sp. Root1204]